MVIDEVHPTKICLSVFAIVSNSTLTLTLCSAIITEIARASSIMIRTSLSHYESTNNMSSTFWSFHRPTIVHCSRTRD
jgi:hypothetical protein